MQPPRIATRPANILIVGANGALGTSLLGMASPEHTVAATRQKNWKRGSFRHVLIGDEDQMQTLDWTQFDTIINVAGRASGTNDELNDANVRFSVNLASASRLGGVRHFIQVSSFSVYGLAELINAATPEVPVNEYGRSKALADRELLALQTDDFDVSIIRLPFLFDVDRPALFAPLLKLLDTIPVLPIAHPVVERSMITYSDAARVLLFAAEIKRGGVFHASAVRPFDFSLLQRLCLEETGRSLKTVKVPKLIVALVGRSFPGLHRRIFQSSVLDPSVNLAVDLEYLDGLEPALRSLFKSQR